MYWYIANIIIVVLIAGFFYESLSWCLRIARSFRWIKEERSRFEIVENSGRTYLLIPVLAEADILERTAAYFSDTFLSKRKNTFLVLITAEREREASGSTTTIDIAKKLARENEHIVHVHFPGRNGKMAHQLNYAIHELSDGNEKLQEADLVGIYNADSRPEKETLDWVVYNFEKNKHRVFQQYGWYVGNTGILQTLPYSSILLAAALWQTRWAMGFEIYNARKQFRFWERGNKLAFNYPLNYCIGHGLFFTKSIFEELGGFNEAMHNEDAIWGLQLSNMQEPIIPIPYFDVSESPDSIKALYEQKANWYLGPLQSYEYPREIVGDDQRSVREKSRLYVLTTKLFFHALYWIGGPTLLVALLILSVSTLNPWGIAVSILAFASFVMIPGFYAYKLTKELGIPAGNGLSSRRAVGALMKGSFGAYLLHGASAYRGIVKYGNRLSGREIAKQKTMMLHRSDR